MRLGVAATLDGGVKLRQRQRFKLGPAADFVQRQQAEVAIEQRVLDRFRHHRTGELLQAEDEVAGRQQRLTQGG